MREIFQISLLHCCRMKHLKEALSRGAIISIDANTIIFFPCLTTI